MNQALLAAGIVALGLSGSSAFAVDYVTAEQAQKILFPAASQWEKKTFALNSDQLQAVAKLAGLPARSTAWVLQVATDEKGNYLGSVIVDQVIGKFELITYAVGVDASGALVGIEILSYRESHGSEIRLPAWRRQFKGKTLAQPIKTGEDIALISGATLSCNHVTDGVRRIVAVMAAARDGGVLAKS